MKNEYDNVSIIDDGETYNDFYASVSVFFRIASFIFLIAFLLFIVYSAFGNQEVFSYESFDYLVRNFALTLDEKRNDTLYSIRYNPDSSRTFALIGNKFALCGNSGISIFSSTGRLICSDSFSFKNPVMLSSEKYALIYDSGSYNYVLYNSFTNVLSQSADKPIRGACMSQNGYFALITSSDEYNSTVEVYNENFKLINRFNKSGYVIDVDMLDDSILIATVDKSTTYGMYDLQLQLYNLTASETISTVNLESSLPFSCKISSAGFFIVCKNEAIIYNLNEDKSIVYPYSEAELFDFEISNDTLLLMLDTSGTDVGYELLRIDANSKALYNYSLDTKVYDIEICGSSTCVLTEGRILIFDSIVQKEIQVDGVRNDFKLLANSNNSVYMCTNSSAQVISITE